MSEDYDFYEDTEQDKSIFGFIRREKRLVGFIAVTLLAFMIFSWFDREMDERRAEQIAHDGGSLEQKNPWAKDP